MSASVYTCIDCDESVAFGGPTPEWRVQLAIVLMVIIVVTLPAGAIAFWWRSRVAQALWVRQPTAQLLCSFGTLTCVIVLIRDIKGEAGIPCAIGLSQIYLISCALIGGSLTRLLAIYKLHRRQQRLTAALTRRVREEALEEHAHRDEGDANASVFLASASNEAAANTLDKATTLDAEEGSAGGTVSPPMRSASSTPSTFSVLATWLKRWRWRRTASVLPLVCSAESSGPAASSASSPASSSLSIVAPSAASTSNPALRGDTTAATGEAGDSVAAASVAAQHPSVAAASTSTPAHAGAVDAPTPAALALQSVPHYPAAADSSLSQQQQHAADEATLTAKTLSQPPSSSMPLLAIRMPVLARASSAGHHRHPGVMLRLLRVLGIVRAPAGSISGGAQQQQQHQLGRTGHPSLEDDDSPLASDTASATVSGAATAQALPSAGEPLASDMDAGVLEPAARQATGGGRTMQGVKSRGTTDSEAAATATATATTSRTSSATSASTEGDALAALADSLALQNGATQALVSIVAALPIFIGWVVRLCVWGAQGRLQGHGPVCSRNDVVDLVLMAVGGLPAIAIAGTLAKRMSSMADSFLLRQELMALVAVSTVAFTWYFVGKAQSSWDATFPSEYGSVLICLGYTAFSVLGPLLGTYVFADWRPGVAPSAFSRRRFSFSRSGEGGASSSSGSSGGGAGSQDGGSSAEGEEAEALVPHFAMSLRNLRLRQAATNNSRRSRAEAQQQQQGESDRELSPLSPQQQGDAGVEVVVAPGGPDWEAAAVGVNSAASRATPSTAATVSAADGVSGLSSNSSSSSSRSRLSSGGGSSAGGRTPLPPGVVPAADDGVAIPPSLAVISPHVGGNAPRVRERRASRAAAESFAAAVRQAAVAAPPFSSERIETGTTGTGSCEVMSPGQGHGLLLLGMGPGGVGGPSGGVGRSKSGGGAGSVGSVNAEGGSYDGGSALYASRTAGVDANLAVAAAAAAAATGSVDGNLVCPQGSNFGSSGGGGGSSGGVATSSKRRRERGRGSGGGQGGGKGLLTLPPVIAADADALPDIFSVLTRPQRSTGGFSGDELKALTYFLVFTPLGREHFRSCLAREFALENLLFLLDAQRYREAATTTVELVDEICASGGETLLLARAAAIGVTQGGSSSGGGGGGGTSTGKSQPLVPHHAPPLHHVQSGRTPPSQPSTSDGGGAHAGALPHPPYPAHAEQQQQQLHQQQQHHHAGGPTSAATAAGPDAGCEGAFLPRIPSNCFSRKRDDRMQGLLLQWETMEATANRRLERVLRRYLSADAELQVNVSSTQVRRISAALAARNLDPLICQPAVSDIIRLLAGGPVHRFAASPQFVRLTAAVAAARVKRASASAPGPTTAAVIAVAATVAAECEGAVAVGSGGGGQPVVVVATEAVALPIVQQQPQLQ